MNAEPRFYVQEFSGWLIPINPGDPVNPKTSFYVMDSEHLHKVVATFENTPRGVNQSLATWKRRAERKAAQLNAWAEAEAAHA